jgi:predicted phosphate transport protein (TIGR00153 family)
MGFREFLRPRKDNFIRLIIEQATKTLEGMEALEEYMRYNSKEAAERVMRAEKEADELRRILVDELNRTFVTPMDREDIFALSRAIDDILDYGDSTVEEMTILDVSPNQHLHRMASLLKDAAHEIHSATLRLQDHPGVAYEHAMRAKALENRVETIYREALADLFQGPATPERIVEMLKLRELYRHLSNSADRGDEAANVITDIVVKMT